MDKLKKIPHKILFYFGLLVVFIFLGLSYWQFSSFQNDNAALEQFKNTNLSSPITIEENTGKEKVTKGQKPANFLKSI